MRRADNLDLLRWFSEDERSRCAACGELACVRLHTDAAAICLACGAVWIGEERFDSGGSLDPEAGRELRVLEGPEGG